MEVIPVIEDVFRRPPIPFSPERQSLKAWAMYCLRDRGFKVVYAQNADFAIETKTGEKLYVKVAEQAEQLEGSVIGIVRDPATSRIMVVAPQG